MKFKHIFYLFAIIALASCSTNTSKDENLDIQTIEKQATDSLCVAFMNLSKVMGPIGGDSEADWAADTIQCIGAKVLENSGSFMERMSNIYVMQSYFAYGMNYFRAIISAYSEYNDISNEVLYGPSAMNLVYREIDSLEYNRVESYIKLSALAHYNTQQIYPLFQIAQRNDEEIDFGPLGSSLLTAQLVDSLATLGYGQHDLLKIHTILDASDFFQSMVCPIQYTTISEDRMNLIKPQIIECANYFDENSNAIWNQYNNGVSKIEIMSDDDYVEFLRKSTNYKCMLLQMLAENFDQIAQDN